MFLKKNQENWNQVMEELKNQNQSQQKIDDDEDIDEEEIRAFMNEFSRIMKEREMSSDEKKKES